MRIGLRLTRLGIAALALAAAAAFAQTPPQVPRASEIAPLQVRPTRDAALPEAPRPPRELAKPDDDLRLDVVRYAVDAGAPAALRDALPRLTGRFTGRDRSFEDLSNAAAEVTRFLQRELGYYLGYAYLPEQVPEGGVIRIAVLEGRLDKIVLQWSDGLPVQREVVENYLSRLVPGSVLLVRDVERVVFLVNDLRGISTRFEVGAGSTPGTATLVVTPRAESTVSGRLEADVNGSRFLGPYRLAGLVQRVSPFGRGDGVTANLLASTTGGLAFGLLSYTTPVGGDGFKLGASLSAVRYQLDQDDFPLDLHGNATTFNAYGLYPLVRSRNLNLFSLASYENKRYADSISDTESRKAVDTLAVGFTGDFRDSVAGGGVSTFELNGLGGRLKRDGGAQSGDTPNFAKVSYGVTRLQDVVTGRLLLYLALRGQRALRNLDTTEQFRLGGPDGVRAFAAGEGTGDSGFVGTAELRWLPPEAWFGRSAREVVMSLFYDAGSAQLRTDPDPTSTAANRESFSAWGLAFAWVRPDAFALRMSVARPASGVPRSDPAERDPRVYLLGTLYFN
jgi:hemolysin activation/secretion protein